MKQRRWVSKFNKKVKFKKVIINITYAIALLLILYNILFFVYTTMTHKEYLEILGVSFFCEENNLMENDIKKNDLIIVKKINDEIKEKDIIAYKVNGEIRINKVIKIIKEEQNGNEMFVTKSNKNYHPDQEKISKKQIIGKVKITIPILGRVVKLMQTKIAAVIVIIVLGLKLNYNIYINTKKEERSRKKRRKERSENHL